MKNLLIILSLTLIATFNSVALHSSSSSTQKVEVIPSYSKFSQANFACNLSKWGISRNMNTAPIIQSLHFSKGKWYVYAGNKQILGLIGFSNGKIYGTARSIVLSSEGTDCVTK